MSLTKRRSTGPSPDVRALVWEREESCCARCGLRGGEHVFPRHEVHHRRPRGMGGTRHEAINSPANLLLLCHACHAFIESRRVWAIADGYLIPQGGDDPRDVKVLYRDRTVLLTHDGSIKETS